MNVSRCNGDGENLETKNVKEMYKYAWRNCGKTIRHRNILTNHGYKRMEEKYQREGS